MKIEKRSAGPARLGAVRAAAMLVLAFAAGGAHDAVFAQQGAQSSPAAAPPATASTAEKANDYPTLARVEYVFECLSDNAGPRHEMVYKCVCAIDRIAEMVPYDRWVELTTFFNAQPIAGERGAYLRDRSDIQSQLKSYRELQLKAKQACFIPTVKK